jgi:hypothetical protein
MIEPDGYINGDIIREDNGWNNNKKNNGFPSKGRK